MSLVDFIQLVPRDCIAYSTCALLMMHSISMTTNCSIVHHEHLFAAYRTMDKPILSYAAKAEINNLKWSNATRDWVAIAFKNQVQMLRV
jgi:hypothetical protein